MRWLRLTKKKEMQNLRMLKSKTHKTKNLMAKKRKDQTLIMIQSHMDLKLQVIMTMLKTTENTLATCTRGKIRSNLNLKL